jgi:hypothetical protein
MEGCFALCNARDVRGLIHVLQSREVWGLASHWTQITVDGAVLL